MTLLLADIEGATRLWETRPGVMSASLAALDRVLARCVIRRLREVGRAVGKLAAAIVV